MKMNNVKLKDNAALFADIEDIISSGGRIQLRVKGYSMRPMLRNDRDLACLAPIPADGLRRGMIVLFRYRGKHVLHRIRRIEGDTLVMKGDGNYRQRETVKKSAVVAYAEAIERDGVRIEYRSETWQRLSAASLMRKHARTLYMDCRNALKRIVGHTA